MSTPSVRTVSQNPTEVAVSVPVTDARGTGAGWFVSIAADASGSTTPLPLIASTATATCADGSECTLPVDTVDYPAAISTTGARTKLFAAAPASGLGAQTVNVRLFVPAGELDGLSLSLSVSTEP